jgi:hypothetical protein
MADRSPPDIEALVASGNRLADAMGQARPEASSAWRFFEDILHTSQDQGGRDLWRCFAAGIITGTELRNVTMARFATWLSRLNDVSEPSSEAFGSPELDRSFDVALFGRGSAQ